ncbi:MAG: cadmium-translocating P-type ATPase [Oscillospiraceae bacterium]|nr:cadmium-translocating P-type ATPase [Oscillospiraceae bacterium]
MTKKQRKTLIRIILAAVLTVVLHFLPVTGIPRFCLYLIPYFIIGYDILRKAVIGIKNGQMLDENFLMATATIGAFAIALADDSGDFDEAVAVMLFYQVGELFQGYAVGKSRRSIAELMDIRPDRAFILRGDSVEEVDPDEVETGSLIVVDPGEKVPIDGIVEDGISTVNTAALTGESLPRDICPGDEVISGSVNMTGRLTIRTTKPAGESTAAKIIELVEESGAKKSRSEQFITRFARIYTPAVCGSALALALLPPVVRLITGLSPEWHTWVYRALTFLVISCPCALVVSIPLSFFAGIGGASKKGILIKGANYLESLSKASVAVFDKTGTLTRGVFDVSDIHHGIMPNEALIRYAAYVESPSSHPISRSIQRAYGNAVDRSIITDIQEIGGHGICAKVDGVPVAAGNGKLMQKIGVEHHECHSPGTIVHMAVDGTYAGHIVISDCVKETSAEAIRKLKAAGVKKTVMLTGDNEKTGRAVGDELGIDMVCADLLPADKVAKVEQLLSEKPEGTTLIFTGDGINDAPVLSRADIGIAMGGLGSDAAIEAADVVIMDDDPAKIAEGLRISRKCMGIVRANIVFAIGIKLLCLILGALGFANMWLAIFADVGVLILCVINAARALRA